jgi:hypothetical protein
LANPVGNPLVFEGLLFPIFSSQPEQTTIIHLSPNLFQILPIRNAFKEDSVFADTMDCRAFMESQGKRKMKDLQPDCTP